MHGYAHDECCSRYLSLSRPRSSVCHRAKCLGGLLAGSIASGFMLAVMMSNAGGAWDNSKYIKTGFTVAIKQCRRAAGDTVGDLSLDTSGRP